MEGGQGWKTDVEPIRLSYRVFWLVTIRTEMISLFVEQCLNNSQIFTFLSQISIF